MNRSQKRFPRSSAGTRAVQKVIAVKPPSKLQKVVRDVNQLKKKQKKVEWKYSSNVYTAPITDQVISTTPFIKLLNDPTDNIQPATAANGNGFDKYSGQQYTMQSIQIDGYLRAQPGVNMFDYVRIALVRYKPANETTPTYTGGNNQVYSSSTPYAFRALTNRNDFIILKEWNIPTLAAGATSGPSVNKRIKYYKNLKGMVVTLNATPAIEENALYLMAIGTNAVAASANPLLSLNVRIRFTDE